MLHILSNKEYARTHRPKEGSLEFCLVAAYEPASDIPSTDTWLAQLSHILVRNGRQAHSPQYRV